MRGFSSHRLLAIDWDSRDLRLALVRQRGPRLELLKAVSVPLPAGISFQDADAFGAFLREAVRQGGVGVRQALFCVPRDQVVLNMLNLPPTPGEELPALVQFQIVKELPFAAEQAAIDFAIAGPHDPKAPAGALVAAVRNETIELYRRAASHAGLSIVRIGLRPHANLLSVLASMPDAAGKALMIIDVGPQLTEINFVRNGALLFSRAALVHMPDFGARGENIADSRIMLPSLHDAGRDEQSAVAIADLMKTVVLTYEAHRATDPTFSPDAIVVSGSIGIEAELADSLAARFGTPASLFSPERAINLEPQRARELRGFGAVLGLALGQARNDLEKFNFDNVKKPVSRHAVRMRKAPVAVLTALLFLATAIVAYYKFVQTEWDAVAKVEADIIAIQDREKPIQDFEKLVTSVKSWRDTEQYWPEAMVALTRALPPDDAVTADMVRFTTISATRRTGVVNHIMMNLRVFELGQGNQIADTLRRMGFDNVVTGQETPIVVRGSSYNYQTKIDADLPSRPRFRKAANLNPVEETLDAPADAAEDALIEPGEPADATTPPDVEGAAETATPDASDGTGVDDAPPPETETPKDHAPPSADSAAPTRGDSAAPNQVKSTPPARSNGAAPARPARSRTGDRSARRRPASGSSRRGVTP